MMFGTQAHGDLLSVINAPRKAKQYNIGNPITASRMTRHNIDNLEYEIYTFFCHFNRRESYYLGEILGQHRYAPVKEKLI
jgi:hypothetical protein